MRTMSIVARLTATATLCVMAWRESGPWTGAAITLLCLSNELNVIEGERRWRLVKLLMCGAESR